MRRTHKRGTKARLSFSGGLHAPVNMADSIEEVNVGGKKAGNGTFAALYRAIFRMTSFRKSPKLFRPDKLSLALVRRSNILRMTMNLAHEESDSNVTRFTFYLPTSK